jgi:tetratricopeptide (TPR) repeat protein
MSPGDSSYSASSWGESASGSPPDLLNARYNLSASEDWQRLERLLDLNEGFALVCWFIDGESGEGVCKAALEGRLRGESKTLLDLSPASQTEVRDLATKLLDAFIPPSTGAVWFGKVVAADHPDYLGWAQAWREALARVNQFRNPVMRSIPVPLILAGAPWLQSVISEAAPDLWSIRTMVGHIEPVSEPPAAPERPVLSINGADPLLALREAEKLRSVPGHELALARLLFRAGEGFLTRNQWREAAEPLREALEIRRSTGAEPGEIASACLRLAQACIPLARGDEAYSLLQEAISQFRLSSDVKGEANSMRMLGLLALQAQPTEGHQLLESALSLYRRAGDARGEAECIRNLGDVANILGLIQEAADRYQEAVSLFRKMGDIAGGGEATRGLGEVARRRGDYESARFFFEQARTLLREAGDQWGEARCVRALAEIAASRNDFPDARSLYEEAVLLSSRIGDSGGEAENEMGLASVLLRHSEPDAALSHADRAITLFRQTGDRRDEARSLARRGDIFRSLKDPVSARSDLELAISLAHEASDLPSEAFANSRLGDLEFGLKNYSSARSHYTAADVLYRMAGDLRGQASIAGVLGDLAARTGDQAEAKKLYEAAIALFHQTGNLRGEANALRSLAAIEGDAVLFNKALDLYRRSGDLLSSAAVLRRLARLTEPGPDRDNLIDQAASVYEEAGREDLVDELNREFPTSASA